MEEYVGKSRYNILFILFLTALVVFLVFTAYTHDRFKKINQGEITEEGVSTSESLSKFLFIGTLILIVAGLTMYFLFTPTFK